MRPGSPILNYISSYPLTMLYCAIEEASDRASIFQSHAHVSVILMSEFDKLINSPLL